MEKIKCAAIKYKLKNSDKYDYVEGLNHAACIGMFSFMDIPVKLRDMNNEIQGFMTTHNRFVDREEAYLIAESNGQLKSKSLSKILISENCNYNLNR